jgi:hypothetical protein
MPPKGGGLIMHKASDQVSISAYSLAGLRLSTDLSLFSQQPVDPRRGMKRCMMPPASTSEARRAGTNAKRPFLDAT